MDAIDRYDAKAIAQDEARVVADELRRDLEYGIIADMRREIDSLRAQEREHGAEFRSALSEVWEAIGDMRTAE